MTYTQSQTKALEADFGPLDWLEITEFGHAERRFLLGTALCAYCKMPNPTGRCQRCGASALRDGETAR